MPELNLQNVTAFFVFIGYLWKFIHVIVRLTPGDKDNNFVERIDKGWLWVQEVSLPFYNAIEELAKNNKIEKAQKPLEFLRTISQAYENAFSAPIPPALEVGAQTIAKIHSLKDKVDSIGEKLGLQVEQIKSVVKDVIGPNTEAN